MKKLLALCVALALVALGSASAWAWSILDGADNLNSPTITGPLTLDLPDGIIGGTALIAYSHTQIPLYDISGWTADPTGTFNLWSYTLPAGTMGPNDTITVRGAWSMGSSANSKSMTVTFGGVSYVAYAVTTSLVSSFERDISNRNSVSRQVGAFSVSPGAWSSSGGAIITSSVDTAANVVIAITGDTSLETGAPGQTTSVVGAAGTCTATDTTHGLATGQYIKMAGGSDCPTSGNPNADPVMVTVTNTDVYTYPCTCVGTEGGTQPTAERYSPINLEYANIYLTRAQ